MVADQTNIFASLAGPALQDTGGSRLMSLNSYEWKEDMGVSERRQRAEISWDRLQAPPTASNGGELTRKGSQAVLEESR